MDDPPAVSPIEVQLELKKPETGAGNGDDSFSADGTFHQEELPIFSPWNPLDPVFHQVDISDSAGGANIAEVDEFVEAAAKISEPLQKSSAIFGTIDQLQPFDNPSIVQKQTETDTTEKRVPVAASAEKSPSEIEVEFVSQDEDSARDAAAEQDDDFLKAVKNFLEGTEDVTSPVSSSPQPQPLSQSHTVQTSVPGDQERPVEQAAVAVDGDAAGHFLDDCPVAKAKPCLYGFGNGCKLRRDPLNPACHICTCPYRSVARGCAGPQGLTNDERIGYLIGRTLCPNGRRAQSVHRWHRSTNSCVLMAAPYCDHHLDVTQWRMPRTKEECEEYCFSPDEQNLSRGFFFEA